MYAAGDFHQVKELVPIFLQFPLPVSGGGVMYYQADFESEWHPVPLVVHAGKLTGLIQPFLSGTKVQYFALLEGNGRFPQSGMFDYSVNFDLRSRLHRRISGGIT